MLTASQTTGMATAQFQTTALAVGAHTITASYVGDTNTKPSISAAQTVTVVQAASTTSLAISAANINAAQPETLTARVVGLTSPAITGTVTFYNGTTSLGNGTLTVAAGTGTATLTIPSLGVGSHSITAHYNGDTDYTASTSAAQTVAVSQIASTTRLAISAANINAGQSETLTATITGVPSPALTGVVTFLAGTTSIGTGSVTATAMGGTATLTLTTLAAGTDSVTAHYGGDTNYTASVSGAQSVTVTGTAQTITFPAIPNHVYDDAAVCADCDGFLRPRRKLQRGHRSCHAIRKHGLADWHRHSHDPGDAGGQHNLYGGDAGLKDVYCDSARPDAGQSYANHRYCRKYSDDSNAYRNQLRKH